jgi:hypothetical protein
MNIRQIKLDLTVKMMNLGNSSNILQSITETMSNFKEEVGAFIDTVLTGDMGLDQYLVKRTYAVRFENCTLSIDLVENQKTHIQYVNGFSLN